MPITKDQIATAKANGDAVFTMSVNNMHLPEKQRTRCGKYEICGPLPQSLVGDMMDLMTKFGVKRLDAYAAKKKTKKPAKAKS